MLMGIFEEAVFAQAGPVRFNRGDTIVIGTEGIWESREPDGKLFGKERLQEIIRSTSGSAEDTYRAVVAAVIAFCGSAPSADDTTLVAVKGR